MKEKISESVTRGSDLGCRMDDGLGHGRHQSKHLAVQLDVRVWWAGEVCTGNSDFTAVDIEMVIKAVGVNEFNLETLQAE